MIRSICDENQLSWKWPKFSNRVQLIFNGYSKDIQKIFAKISLFSILHRNRTKYNGRCPLSWYVIKLSIKQVQRHPDWMRTSWAMGRQTRPPGIYRLSKKLYITLPPSGTLKMYGPCTLSWYVIQLSIKHAQRHPDWMRTSWAMGRQTRLLWKYRVSKKAIYYIAIKWNPHNVWTLHIFLICYTIVYQTCPATSWLDKNQLSYGTPNASSWKI